MKVIRYRGMDGGVALATLDEQGEAWALDGELFDSPAPTQRKVNPVEILTPLDPVAIIGIGLNYRKHVEETGRKPPEFPMIFIKLPWAATPHQAPIVLPAGTAKSHKVDYEGELAVIIGREARDVPEAEALDYVYGYTCANDVSARDWQFDWGGGQFCRGKTFDSFCPLGPCITTADDIPEPAALHLTTELNGDTVQDTPVSDLIFNIPSLIAFLSSGTTLLPGTVILTGTPGGVGHAAEPTRYLRPGDTVAITISQIGTLVNPVVEAPEPAKG